MSKTIMYAVRFAVFTTGFVAVVVLPQVITQALGAQIVY